MNATCTQRLLGCCSICFTVDHDDAVLNRDREVVHPTVLKDGQSLVVLAMAAVSALCALAAWSGIIFVTATFLVCIAGWTSHAQLWRLVCFKLWKFTLSMLELCWRPQQMSCQFANL